MVLLASCIGFIAAQCQRYILRTVLCSFKHCLVRALEDSDHFAHRTPVKSRSERVIALKLTVPALHEKLETHPSAVDNHRSSFGSSISLRSSPSGNDSSTITSGSVEDGALITSRRVLRGARGLATVAVEGEWFPSPTSPRSSALTAVVVVSTSTIPSGKAV